MSAADEAPAHERVLAYDAGFVPRFAQRFGRRLLEALDLPPKAHVLDLGCRTGYPCVDLVDRHDDVRVIAVDPSPEHLELARARAGAHLGKRVFFKQDTVSTLRFGDEVFTNVYANLADGLGTSRAELLSASTRMLQKGGQFVATLPLRGSFAEAVDLLREVALGHELPGVSERIEGYVAAMPGDEALRVEVEAAGYTQVLVESWEFTLEYPSSEALFGDPVVTNAALPGWRWCAEAGAAPEAVLRALRHAVDTYFEGRDFTLTVVGGCVSARRAG